MKYLKMGGAVLLVMSAYFAIQWLAASAFGVYISISRQLPITQEAFERHFEDRIIYISIISNLLALLFFRFFFAVQRTFAGKKESLASYCLFRKAPASRIIAALLMGVSLYLLNAAVFHYAGLAERFPEHHELLRPLFKQHILVSFLGVGVIAAFAEEVVFRGIIFNRMRKDLPLASAVFAQAVLFGMMHLNFLQAGYAFILGVFCGLVYSWTGSIRVPFAVHFSFNTASIIFVRASRPELDYSGAAALPVLISGLVLLAFTMRFFARNKDAGSQPSGEPVSEDQFPNEAESFS